MPGITELNPIVIRHFLDGKPLAIGASLSTGDCLYINNIAIAYRNARGEIIRIKKVSQSVEPSPPIDNGGFFLSALITILVIGGLFYLIFGA